MRKEKNSLGVHVEKPGSGNIVWSIISTPSGLETWFADKVTFKDKVFTFIGEKQKHGKLKLQTSGLTVLYAFEWLDDEDPKSLF